MLRRCFQQIERWSFIEPPQHERRETREAGAGAELRKQSGVHRAEESMWFCWETLMTIGLGDLVPQTVLGRILAQQVFAQDHIRAGCLHT